MQTVVWLHREQSSEKTIGRHSKHIPACEQAEHRERVQCPGTYDEDSIKVERGLFLSDKAVQSLVRGLGELHLQQIYAWANLRAMVKGEAVKEGTVVYVPGAVTRETLCRQDHRMWKAAEVGPCRILCRLWRNIPPELQNEITFHDNRGWTAHEHVNTFCDTLPPGNYLLSQNLLILVIIGIKGSSFCL